jgi:predicted membrane channel-forming protein YqfA (hemolysin III family)
VLLKLVLAAPVAPIVIANLNNPEPWADNLIMYALLLLVFGAAGLTTIGYYYFNNVIHDPLHFVTYALVGAVGAAVFTTLVDAADDYSSPAGLGFYLTGVGLLLGALFGNTFRSLIGLVTANRPVQG